jgi:MoxR-like ATPase
METLKNFDQLTAQLDNLSQRKDPRDIAVVRDATRAMHAQLGTVIYGYDDPKWKLIYALLADGHVLMESVPGLAKSLLVSATQRLFQGASRVRIQFTPDLTTSEIGGVPIFNPGKMQFDDRPGPVVGCNILLADEVNRAPGKVQSALLSAMQERRVIVGNTLFRLEDPFFVLATQNPIENEGTYPLPEAQLDRFMLKVVLPYLPFDQELQFALDDDLHERDAEEKIRPVVRVTDLVELRKYIRQVVYRSPTLAEYILKLVRFTRPHSPEFNDFRAKVALKDERGARILGLVEYGASPRSVQTFSKLGMVRAACSGRAHVMPEDVAHFALEVLRHRIILKPEAAYTAEGRVTSEDVIKVILKHTPVVQDPAAYKKPSTK